MARSETGRGMLDLPGSRPQAKEPSSLDSYFSTPEGKDLQDWQSRVERGEVDIGTAMMEFRKKWYGGKPPVIEGEASHPIIPELRR